MHDKKGFPDKAVVALNTREWIGWRNKFNILSIAKMLE